MRFALALWCAALFGCRDLPADFQCHDHGACVFQGEQGSCEPIGYCSFADSTCGSGRRFGDHAGQGLANQCAGEAVHLSPTSGFAGTGDLDIGTSIIDTSSLQIPGVVLPAGVSFELQHHHLPFGPDIAVLRTRQFTIRAGATVRVVGQRPLVVIAGSDVLIAGVLDAGAHREQPGPGGARGGAGRGAGLGGQKGTYPSGGGGGSFGRPGGKGGPAATASKVLGGEPGPTYGNGALTVLEGGSGGGGGAPALSTCTTPPPGGAGGGAVQISSATVIRIGDGGAITVGGGGAPTGCPGGGGGGGSAGSVFLQASMVLHRGILAANGGGGAAGSGAMLPGGPGTDGEIGSQPAPGGASARMSYGSGGLGGAGELSDPKLNAPHDGFYAGGGGGGGVGRIRILTPQGGHRIEGVVSPAAVIN